MINDYGVFAEMYRLQQSAIRKRHLEEKAEELRKKAQKLTNKWVELDRERRNIETEIKGAKGYLAEAQTLERIREAYGDYYPKRGDAPNEGEDWMTKIGIKNRHHLPHPIINLPKCQYHGLGASHKTEECPDPHNSCLPGELCKVIPAHKGKVPRCPYEYLVTRWNTITDQESMDRIQKTLQPFRAPPSDNTPPLPVETLPRTPVHLPRNENQNASDPRPNARSKGPGRGRGQPTQSRMVASTPSRNKGKGRARTNTSGGEKSPFSPDVLSKDKFPMTDEYLEMCKYVWNCTKKHAEEAFPNAHMGTVVGLFRAKKREEERKERENREKEEANQDYGLEGGEDPNDYIDWEAQDRGD
jgi:hypothetical protein